MSITLPQAAFTIHTVVKLDDWSNATSETIWECYGNFINYVRLEKVSGTLKVTALFNGTTREASTTISYSGYYFITCIIREGSTDGIQVFVNDSEQSYDDVNNRDSTGLTFSGDLIGCYLGKGKSNPNNPLDGKIDQLIPFSKALTSTEVSTIYNLGDGLHHKDLDGTETFYSNIVAWYDFNRPDAFGQDYHTGGLDLTPVSITSANAVLGHIEGKAAGYDGVTKWLDRSGNGNDVSQSTLADCPYFDAATNSVIFTGTQNLVTSGNIGLTGDFTIFEVKAYSDVTEVVDTVGINGNLIRNIGSGSERNVWSTTPDNNSTRLVNNTFAITAQNLEDGVSGNFWTNGVKDDAFSDTTMVRTDGPLKINQDTGIVGELRYKAVLYWNRKLTDSEMATVFKYLNDLYGVY